MPPNDPRPSDPSSEPTSTGAGREPITHVALVCNGRIWALPKPYRHHHIFMVIHQLGEEANDRGIQGFIDADGRFLSRKQAEVSARINGQIKNDGKLIGSVLTSEDLW